MKVRIKDWDEAVKAALTNDEDWYVENGSIFGISGEYGAWGEVVEGYKDGKYFRDEHHFAYPLCVVDKIEDDNVSVNPDDILRYGEVITDDDVSAYYDSENVRIRLIAYDGKLYRHKMVDGEVIDCRYVGKANA